MNIEDEMNEMRMDAEEIVDEARLAGIEIEEDENGTINIEELERKLRENVDIDEVDDGLRKHLYRKIISAKDSRDALNFAKAYGEIHKYDIERYRTECDVYEKAERREMDKLKILDEEAYNTEKLKVDREKIEADRSRYRAEERAQKYRANRQSKDNKLMLGAFVLGYGVTLGTEIKGIMMSKNIRTLGQLIKFIR